MTQKFINRNSLGTDQHTTTTVSDRFITRLHIFTQWEKKWFLIQVTHIEALSCWSLLRSANISCGPFSTEVVGYSLLNLPRSLFHSHLLPKLNKFHIWSSKITTFFFLNIGYKLGNSNHLCCFYIILKHNIYSNMKHTGGGLHASQAGRNNSLTLKIWTEH